MFENGTFGDLGGGGNISRGKRDLLGIPQDLPILLQTSPGTNGMPKNLLRPVVRNFERDFLFMEEKYEIDNDL